MLVDKVFHDRPELNRVARDLARAEAPALRRTRARGRATTMARSSTINPNG